MAITRTHMIPSSGRTLLVTGLTGFVGRHLYQELSESGFKVVAWIRSSSDRTFLEAHGIPYIEDNLDIEQLLGKIKLYNIGGCIHLASCYLKSHQPSDIDRLISSNVTLGVRILEVLIQAKVPWMINTGTFWQFNADGSYHPSNLYAATKQAFENIGAYYREAKQIKFVTLMLSDTYGPNDTRPKILNMWKLSAKTSATIKMSPGEQLLNMCHISDVASAFCKLVFMMEEEEALHNVYKVSAPNLISLRDLAQLFEKVASVTLPIEWGALSYRPREIMVPWQTGIIVPGWHPKISFEDGIRSILE